MASNTPSAPQCTEATPPRHLPSCMLIDPEAGILAMVDAIAERLAKAAAVLNALSEGENDALWCVEDQIREADALTDALWEKVRNHLSKEDWS